MKYSQLSELLNQLVHYQYENHTDNIKSSFLFYKEGLSWLNLGKHEQAIRSFNKAIIEDNTNGLFYYSKGLLLDNIHEALDHYNKAIELNLNIPEVYNDKGSLLYKLGDVIGAIEAFSKATNFNPTHIEDKGILYNKALCLYELKEYDEAMALYGNIINIDANYANAYYGQSLILKDLEKYKEAIDKCDQAIVLNSNLLEDILYNKALCLYRLKEYNQAIEVYDKVISFNSYNAKAYYNKSLALYELKQYQLAVEANDKAIALNPPFLADIYYNKASSLYELKDYTTAVELCNKIIELDSNYVNAYCNKGLYLYNLGEIDQAVKNYNKAIELDSNHIDATYNRAVVLHQSGEKELALEGYDKVLELSSSHTDARYNRAIILSSFGHKQQAIEELNRVLNLDPNYINAYKAKANALKTLGHSEEAAECLANVRAIESGEDLSNKKEESKEEETHKQKESTIMQVESYFRNPLLENEEILKDLQARYGGIVLNQRIKDIDELEQNTHSTYQEISKCLLSTNSYIETLSEVERILGLQFDYPDSV